MYKKPLFIVLLLFNFIACYGQMDEIGVIQKSLHHVKDSSQYVNSLNRLGMLLYEKNIDSTFYYTRKAREIAERLHDKPGVADALNNLGIVYVIKGNLQLALRFYNEAYTAYTAINDSANRVQTLMNIAMVYKEIGKDKRAIQHYNDAMALGKKLSRDSIMSLVIYNYLEEYPQQFPKDSVNWYINKAKNIAIKYKDERVALFIDQLIADDEISKGQKTEGLALLRKTISKSISQQDYYSALDMLIDIGDQLAATDSAMAVSYYRQGLSIAMQNSYLYYNEVMARKLYDFYTLHHDIKTASAYSQAFIQAHDEQEKVNNATSVDYIDYALKDQQLESVRIRSYYESGLLIMAVVACIMAVVIIIIVWRNWKNSQKTATVLRIQFEQSENSTAALDAMNKDYARLIKIVAHDLRNPIGAVSSIASIIVSKNELDEDMHELALLLQASANNSLELINELLETNLDQQQNLVKETFLIDELLNQCISLLSFRAKDKNQHLALHTETGLTVLADREKIWRVIDNLVVNAIKFSPENSNVYIDARLSGKKIIINVKDNGVGIPAEMQGSIFDPFTSVKRKGTGGEESFGLGLYISKQIIEAHQGKISVISQIGNGAEFLIELPASTN